MFKALWMGLICLALTACPAGTNPLAKAETFEQKAFASYGTFVVYEEQAAKLVLDPAFPNDVKRAVALADQAAKPVADSTVAAALEVAAIRADLAAGDTTEEKLAIATAKLNEWTIKLAPLVGNLVKAFSVAKKCGKLTGADRDACEVAVTTGGA